jgi:hypothetical protein
MARRTNVLGIIYLLHFEPPYKHAKHYLGWASDRSWVERLAQQVNGLAKCANLVRVALDTGCTVTVARIWEGVDRNRERRMKNWGKSHLCPICLEKKRLEKQAA